MPGEAAGRFVAIEPCWNAEAVSSLREHRTHAHRALNIGVFVFRVRVLGKFGQGGFQVLRAVARHVSAEVCGFHNARPASGNDEEAFEGQGPCQRCDFHIERVGA